VSHLTENEPPELRTPTDPAPTAGGHEPVPTRRRHLVALPSLTPLDDEDGSLVAEYGLLAVVAAVVAGVLMNWARTGALSDFFSALLDHARNLVIA
jgi:Flp pilus assembly pilin Flp